MKIIDKRGAMRPAYTTLRAIPVGQVFSGEVYGHNSKQWTRGVFYKATEAVRGTYTLPGASTGTALDTVVVRIDQAGRIYRGGSYWSNLWLRDSDVRDYQPLDVELVIK